MKARAVAPSFARRLAIAALAVTVLALPRALPAGTGGRHPEAASLAHAARQAADAIRLHQKPGGYWANPTTRRPVFAQPVLEANTFVPSVVLELIEPIARQTGLAGAVERARVPARPVRGERARALPRPAGCRVPPALRVRHHAGFRRHGARLAARVPQEAHSAAARPSRRPPACASGM